MPKKPPPKSRPKSLMRVKKPTEKRLPPSAPTTDSEEGGLPGVEAGPKTLALYAGLNRVTWWIFGAILLGSVAMAVGTWWQIVGCGCGG